MKHPTTVSNPFITPENTLAEIVKHADAAGVFMEPVTATVTKDRQDLPRVEHEGHYLVSGLLYQMNGFIAALRQRSYRAAHLDVIQPGIDFGTFEMPAARVTLTRASLGRFGTRLLPNVALLAFVPVPASETWGEQDTRDIIEALEGHPEAGSVNSKVHFALCTARGLRDSRSDVVALFRRYIQTVRSAEGSDFFGALENEDREQIRKITGL